MSCGLGAIVLVFILVKPDTATDNSEVEQLERELSQLQNQSQSLDDSINQTTDMLARAQSQNIKSNNNITALNKRLATSKDDIKKAGAAVSELRKSIEKIPLSQASDVVENKSLGEESYLLGLKVEGNNIVFLVDASSSMTDEKLIDIIRRKFTSDKNRKSGPKWQRVKRIVRWLVSRAPAQSRISVISFNEQAKFLGRNGWKDASNPGHVKKIYADLDNVIPSGSTNLQKGLAKVLSLNSEITNLYLITDGLPTTGSSNYAGLNPFSSCSSLFGRSSTITGECREKLFQKTITDVSSRLTAKVNVILLPLEGDPLASPNFWAWTASSGGLLISPAPYWP